MQHTATPQWYSHTYNRPLAYHLVATCARFLPRPARLALAKTIAPLFQRMEDLGIRELWSDAPGVADWFKRIKARPSYGVAFYEGSRLFDSLD